MALYFEGTVFRKQRAAPRAAEPALARTAVPQLANGVRSVVRRTVVADLGLELAVGRHARGDVAIVTATWLGGPLDALDEVERTEAEKLRVRAAQRFAHDLGLVYGGLA